MRPIADPVDPAGISIVTSGNPSRLDTEGKSGADVDCERTKKRVEVKSSIAKPANRRRFICAFLFQARIQGWLPLQPYLCST